MIAVRRLADLPADARDRILKRPSVVTPDVVDAVAKIVAEVRTEGDAALRRLTRKFDKADLACCEVTPAEVAAAARQVSQQDQVAIRSAVDTVTRYHKADVPKPFEMTPVKGVLLGKLAVPFETAGFYIPGGLAAYPSSVVMASIPAQVAGVKQRILCTPPGADGSLPPAILFAAQICGVQRIFKVGGAQAVAAMAYGTATVPRVEIIAGPGNKWVTAAKKAVSGDVAIDFLAGPTEVLVVSDGEAGPKFIAADLIAQAEHDPLACCIFVTSNAAQADAVAGELKRQAPLHPRADIIREALENHGAILVAATLDEALAFANDYGPEHLVLAVKTPMKALGSVRHAGAVFLGEYTPVAVGDYGVGPNAILPTLGEARRSPGLSAGTFIKPVTYAMLTREGLQAAAPPALTLARLEGLEAHRHSIDLRLGK